MFPTSSTRESVDHAENSLQKVQKMLLQLIVCRFQAKAQSLVIQVLNCTFVLQIET